MILIMRLPVVLHTTKLNIGFVVPFLILNYLVLILHHVEYWELYVFLAPVSFCSRMIATK